MAWMSHCKQNFIFKTTLLPERSSVTIFLAESLFESSGCTGGVDGRWFSFEIDLGERTYKRGVETE